MRMICHDFTNFAPDRTIFKGNADKICPGLSACTKSPNKMKTSDFFLSIICCKAIILSIKLTDATGCYFSANWPISQKPNCHHTIFSLDISKTIPSLSASVERLNFVEQSETINLTSRTLMFGKQFLLVTSSKPACRCLLFSLLHVKRWKRETFLHAKKEIGDMCNQVTLKWPWWVKKQLHNNYLFIF